MIYAKETSGVAKELELRYGPDIVGTVQGVFYSDSTWYGVFRLAIDAPQDIRDFVAFSEEWHDRLKAGMPHSAGEFDAYREVYASPLWHVRGPDGIDHPVSMPAFIEGEITWREAQDA